MSGQRWIALFSTLALLVLAPSWARADSLSVQANNITFDRAVPRKDDESPLAISRQDCVDDVLIHFPVTIRANSRPMEVWVGNGDCTVEQQRIDGICVNVWEDYVTSQTGEIVISAQTLLEGETGGSCDATGSRDAVTLQMLFAFDQNAKPSTMSGEFATIQIAYDLQGPPAPTITDVKAGEGKAIVKWSDSDSSGTPVGFRLYCATGTETGAMTIGAAGAGSTSCASDLTPGQVPDSQYQCGEVAGQSVTSATAKGLENNQPYAVGVAAVDSVGNVGELALGSGCVVPQEVTDFYEAYVAAGGKGGGGYCSFGLGHPGAPTGLLLLALMGFGLRRRLAS